ncbi:MAG: ABC transporter substrate-binding protein, partial [Vibrio sp.]
MNISEKQPPDIHWHQLWQRRFIFLTCLLLGLTGCDTKLNANTDEIRQTGFVYCSPGTFNTLNPQLNEAGIVTNTIAPQIFDTLVTLNKKGQPEPSLATKWQESADHTQYLFTLRDDVPFQYTAWFTPSRLLNAQDVVFSFNRMLDSTNPFHYVHQGHYPRFESSGLSMLIDSVTAVDDHHVLFKLKRPSHAFVENLSASFSAIHSKEYADQLVESGQKRHLDTLPVGTGPYQFVSSSHQKIIRLVLNDYFWDKPAILKQVVFNL